MVGVWTSPVVSDFSAHFFLIPDTSSADWMQFPADSLHQTCTKPYLLCQPKHNTELSMAEAIQHLSQQHLRLTARDVVHSLEAFTARISQINFK